jgi:hypothetical protein
MLQHGYNKSEVAPYLYEASTLSTTIALQCAVTSRHHYESASGFGPLRCMSSARLQCQSRLRVMRISKCGINAGTLAPESRQALALAHVLMVI